MTELSEPMTTIYDGWHTHQARLIAALTPLTDDQLALRAAPDLRSIGDIARHMIGARARWFYLLMNEGGDAFATLGAWDRPEMPTRSAAELVTGLETTWQGMQEAIRRWTPDDWQQTYLGEGPDEPATITRYWVIWHLIEHDLHHGGEIGITLGAHGLPAPDL
ncbi:MAG TPA: DinB family protein [Herpetosiphonaceae bacterium]